MLKITFYSTSPLQCVLNLNLDIVGHAREHHETMSQLSRKRQDILPL